jgi:hypothetical protein
MTVTLDEFMSDFTLEERAEVKARTAASIERELTLTRQTGKEEERAGRIKAGL